MQAFECGDDGRGHVRVNAFDQGRRLRHPRVAFPGILVGLRCSIGRRRSNVNRRSGPSASNHARRARRRGRRASDLWPR
jgi:hypothetical protein